MFKDIYRNKRVLVTGHTGFKGSWLTVWLRELGAEVCGVALPMPEELNHLRLLNPQFRSEMLDIRDLAGLKKVFSDFRPDAVFHLAAQPLVRLSYQEPVATFEANVMGTVNVLEACRTTESVRAVVAITSDKCYENREWLWGYRENEPMGGYDPYSASKGCSELVISSYRRSFFNNGDFGVKTHALLASGRAGNVIGGGDWAADRLVPDIMKAASCGRAVTIRSPKSTRPWQHVLEPLSGYLALGQKLLEGKPEFADGWNFGPADDGVVTVEDAAAELAKAWSDIRIVIDPPKDAPHEAALLRLDCSKARQLLAWHGVWSAREAFGRTAEWYRRFYQEKQLNTAADLNAYVGDAAKRGLAWTK
ncbi:MAG: CDP-glucose 4,6-dehydratase [Victivallaceae bacterium]|nr:CDP-glucose 4,6-dehydratase [Victivallaceae bacterium]